MAKTAELTWMEQQFVDEFSTSKTATEAAIKAGYSKKTAAAAASRLLTVPRVAKALAQRQQRISKKFEITAERIVEEYARVAFANIGDYVSVTSNGDPFIDLRGVRDNPDKMTAIAEVTCDDVVEGRGDDKRTVRRIRVKLHDKLAALTALHKALGFDKAIDVNVNGTMRTIVTVRLPIEPIESIEPIEEPVKALESNNSRHSD